ncbi:MULTISPECIES: helix-turn-helix domain-containing protein [Mammaliicoccus]|uniref:helix-turn-helix domain-containing protein n=1 Tax=Mammaliicoccus TaxID=2803850 RepID=UPI001EFBDE2A|nr:MULTISPECIES: helix-turn-helix transcriptional regulator [Mammaliicoccus]MEB7049795.1 helix-turn-helix domain-containing protein [Mammaliicoccus sciuri]
MELSKLLKELRESRGLNKQELANKINISRSYISRIEGGSVDRPAKKVLLKLGYFFDPDGNDDIYKKLLESSNYDLHDYQKDFQEYIKKLNTENKLTDQVDPKKLSELKYRINKHDKTVVYLDYPYMNLQWLIYQEDFNIYCGHHKNIFILDDNNNEYNAPFKLDDEEINLLRSYFEKFKREVVDIRNKKREQKDIENIKKGNDEYNIIFSLLNDGLPDDKKSLQEQIYNVNNEMDTSIFLAKEYYDELKVASNNKDALTLQKLIRLKTLNELKEFLNN